MFERFTDRARRVLVLAQEEARFLNHNYIGTEHLLLGLIHEHEGIAAQALAQMDISLEAVRDKVVETIGLSGAPPIGSPPFTPRAKTVLELSLREALQLGHNYIGTEHILLGLIREGEGVGAQVLAGFGATLDETREIVLSLLHDWPITEDPSSALERPRLPSGSWAVGTTKGMIVGGGCSFCGRQPPETGQLFTGNGASICERCVRQWSEQLEGDEGSGDD
jgi:ATP-dependent Clp protease ATP-binding subunit ClpC